jgi:hypothetical protein
MEAQARIANTAATAPATGVQLRPNPFSQVTVRREDGVPMEIRIWCVTRSRGAVTRNFARGKHANFERIYQAAAGCCAAGAKSLSDLVVLAALGLWAPQDELIDPVHVFVPLQPLPDERLPPRPLEGFALRGAVWLQEGAEPPPHLCAIPLACLSPARPILWHQGSAAEPALPWWPDEDCVAAVSALQGLVPCRPDMLPALMALVAQGIAVDTGGNGGSWVGPNLESHRRAFSQHGFTAIERMLPPGQVAALRSYWRKLAALDVIPDRGDDGTRRGSHGEPSSALLLHLLQPLVEEIVGADIKPAYSYAWLYRRGAAMPRHRDRDACRCTVTLLVDFAPAIDGPTPWPLGIHARGGDAALEVRQSVGDAIIFNGRELKHFRPPFVAGTRSTSLLLHYVDRDFPGVLF